MSSQPPLQNGGGPAMAASNGEESPGDTSSGQQQEQQDAILLEPYTYITQIPGKNIRSKLCKAFDYWLSVPQDKLAIISDVAQMLHNASLLIDDIEDNSKLRRGIPVAHSIYGVANTINAANFVYFLGLQKALTLQHDEVTRIFTEQLLELHRGQGMDIYWRDSVTIPTIPEYKSMVIKKTGGLFGLAVRLMQLFSSGGSSGGGSTRRQQAAAADLKPLADTLGLYFQIRDDYANLTSDTYTDNKSYCEDLSEGKFSFPIIHGIRQRPDNSQILYILKQRTESVEVKKYCVKLLREYGSFDFTRDALIELESSALKQIAALGGNPLLVALIGELKKVYTGGETTHSKQSTTNNTSSTTGGGGVNSH